jgi:hypothetical protein
MTQAFTVNEALDRIDELADSDIYIHGLLCFEFEDVSISHVPRAEQREGYLSSIWLSVGDGALGFDRRVCESLSGKIVVVEGRLINTDPVF